MTQPPPSYNLAYFYPVIPVAKEQIEEQLLNNQLSSPIPAIKYGLLVALEMMGFTSKSEVKNAFISDTQSYWAYKMQ